LKHLYRLAAIVIVTLVVATPAAAQVFFTYPDAHVVQKTRIFMGPYVAAGPNNLYRASGYARLGMTDFLEGGVELVAERRDGETIGGGGLDLKFGLLPDSQAIPFDIALNVGVGFLRNDALRVFQIPLGGIISAAYDLESGRVFIPYLGAYLLIVDTKSQRNTSTPVTNTDWDAELRLGAQYRINPSFAMYASIHFGREGLFLFGLDFRL